MSKLESRFSFVFPFLENKQNIKSAKFHLKSKLVQYLFGF